MFRYFSSLVLVVGLSVSCNAGYLNSILTFNGIADSIDNTAPGLVGIIDNGGGPGLHVGDVGFGFVTSNTVSNDGTGTPGTVSRTIVTMFAAEVASSATPGLFSLVAPTAPGQTLFGLLSAASNGFAAQFDTASLKSDTIAMVISSNFPQGTGALTGASGPTTSDWLSAAEFSPTNYDFEALLDISDGGFFDLFTFAAPPITSGIQSGGFSVTKHALDPSTIFVPVPATKLPSGSQVLVDVGLGPLFVSPSLDGQPNKAKERGWVLTGSVSSVTINVVPEPSSAMCFAAIALATVCGVRRRRGQVAQA
ncbi:hypothetical protein TBK1r_18070 [Stieleria magnilauensis]|uniref:PEP-CTERM protein-sorting domain-containing protein n=2 Tax=Stieleria magnilauensis TaxID=2527963 RepID=A0ABX5XLL3_9BACT|nr:hypothetical protein TBK1r_18070 [Planctomycetes bacterium TBK1r]